MIPVLFLAHGLIALAAVASKGLDRPQRERFLQGCAVAGGALGLVLFFASPLLGDTWRTAEMTPSGTRLAGIAIAAAWIVVAVGERSRGGGRWDIVALTGVASTGLALYSVNRWTVPALLFAGIAALAIAGLHHGRGVPVAAVAVAMGALAGALSWHTLDAGSWALPEPIEGGRAWIAVVSAALFAIVPLVSEAVDRPSPASPLALGLSFATFASVAQGAGPVAALVFVLAALVAVVRSLLVARGSQRIVLSWVIAVTVGLAALSGNLYVMTRAGIAGILAASAIALWPLSLGRAQIERGVLVAFVAVTAGFNAIASAASYSFERATSFERVLDAAPWAAISALLPVALAAGVALGASVGRNPEPDEFTRSGVIGSWALVLLAVVVGMFPYVGDDVDGGFSGPGLYAVAVLAGVAASRYARGLAATASPPPSTTRFLDVPVRIPWAGAAEVTVRGVGALTAVGLVALTFQGLRLGFL